MVKTKVIFACQACGSQYAQWQGQCRDCQAWNTLVEEVSVKSHPRLSSFSQFQSQLTHLAEVPTQSQPRLSTGLAEFDHVLGGGLVSDSAILIGGDPGVGKSTLLLQIMTQLSKHYRTLYVTGEESLQQVALRAERLGVRQHQLTLLAEVNVERILSCMEQHQSQIVVIDSIQTAYTDRVTSAPGGVGQVRESAAQLVSAAKSRGIALFLVGHVTKEGAIAGPRVLEHMVDAVLYFEGRNDTRYRVIRAVKNRFGAVNEIGVFAMTDTGLKAINNPSAIFLSHYEVPTPGSVITVTWEGSRPLLVEVQALVDTSHLSNPRRVTVGLEQNRLAMLLAILHRHGGIATYDQDVFVNAVGGLHISETSADLPLLLAVLSSLKNKPLPSDLIVFGEVGLSGEIRPVPSGQERIKEAAKHGFKRAIVPKANVPKIKPPNMEVQAAHKLTQVLTFL